VAGGKDMADFHNGNGKKKKQQQQQDPVSPRINFKYDSRLGLFGFDIEAERQSKRENYELMRMAKKNEEIAVMARARAHVVYGAGVMDAKTILPEGFSDLKQRQQSKVKVKKVNHVRHPSRDRHQMRSKSDFKADPKVEQDVRSISSDNANHNHNNNNHNNNVKMKNKHIHKAHIEDEILSKYKQNNLDAMQCSPIEAAGRKKKAKKGVHLNPNIVITDAEGHDFFYDDSADHVDQHHDIEVLLAGGADPHDHEGSKFQEVMKKRGATPPPHTHSKHAESSKKVKISPLKLSAIKRKRNEESKNPSYVESSAPSPSPRHDKPFTPTLEDKKNSFQRKSRNGQVEKEKEEASAAPSPRRVNHQKKGAAKSPRKSPRKKSPRRRPPPQESSISSVSVSPGRKKLQTKFDIDVFDSVSMEDPVSDTKSKPPTTMSPGNIATKKKINKNKAGKKSIADELFEEFEAFNLNASPTTPPSKAPTIEKEEKHAKKNPPRGVAKAGAGAGAGEQKSKRRGSVSPRGSAVARKQKTRTKPSRAPLAEVAEDTPVSSLPSKKTQKHKQKPRGEAASVPVLEEHSTGAAKGVVVEDDDDDYEDDTEVYADEDFDDDGDGDGGGDGSDHDVKFDFSPEIHESEAEKEEEVRRRAKEEEDKNNALMAKAEQEESERLARQKAEQDEERMRIKLEEEKNVALAKEEKRKARAAARAKADEDERVAQAKKREEVAEAKRVAEAKAKQEEADRLAAEKAEQEARAAAARKEEEENRFAAEAKAKENERLKSIEIASCKEEKLEKASKIESTFNLQDDSNATAFPKNNNLEIEADEYDDYNLDDEDFDNEATEQDATSPVLFDMTPSSPGKQLQAGDEGNASSEPVDSLKKLESPSPQKCSPIVKNSPKMEIEDDVVSDDDYASDHEPLEEDGHDKDNNNDDVLFDFKKNPSPLNSSVAEASSLPPSSPHVHKNSKTSTPEKSISGKEEEEEEEYGSDYDDDFD
jgi:hypothetical protein